MNKISKNIIASVVLQIVSIISGLIIPRLIIQSFGSNINGLVSSITQFSNYIALLEGGVASVMMANLYRPLHEHDNEKLSSTYVTMTRFFQRISMVFIFFQVGLALVYPIVIDTGYDFQFVFSLTLILGISIFIQYNFSISARLLLEADNKIYITKTIQSIFVIANTIAVFIGIKFYPNIHLVKLCSAIVFVLQPLLFHHYLNKYYNLDKKAKPDKTIISQRWDGFGINLSAFIHNNTDVVVLTVFANLLIVSVYNIHMYVVSGIKQLIIAMMISFVPTLGKYIVGGDHSTLNDFFRKYEFICFALSSFAFSLGASLIVPFVRIYTNGITDINYYEPIFSVLIICSEWLYCIREPYVELSYQSNHFKDIKMYAYIEAIINIVISIILVRWLGLIGVAVGTLFAMAYRTIMQVLFSRKILPGADKEFFRYFFSMLITGIINNIIIRLLPIYSCTSIVEFIFLTLTAFAINCVLFVLTSFIVNKEVYISLFRRTCKGVK